MCRSKCISLTNNCAFSRPSHISARYQWFQSFRVKCSHLERQQLTKVRRDSFGLNFCCFDKWWSLQYPMGEFKTLQFLFPLKPQNASVKVVCVLKLAEACFCLSVSSPPEFFLNRWTLYEEHTNAQASVVCQHFMHLHAFFCSTLVCTVRVKTSVVMGRAPPVWNACAWAPMPAINF